VRVIVGAAILSGVASGAGGPSGAGSRVLAAERAVPADLAGRWEFPGGKVEAGETDHDAVVRECREELGVEVAVGERLGADVTLPGAGPGGLWVLRVWLATIRTGTPVPLEHRSLRWLGSEELFDVPWLPADLPLVVELQRLLSV